MPSVTPVTASPLPLWLGFTVTLLLVKVLNSLAKPLRTFSTEVDPQAFKVTASISFKPSNSFESSDQEVASAMLKTLVLIIPPFAWIVSNPSFDWVM